ncbi:MAG: glycoside hydrolase family 65 [Oscillospiraceae bacterium]|nr:glycoside hydrolase family 65 [Oscillospiraceae bacterium]
MINRKNLVSRHNPVLSDIDAESPLTVGNGDFAFTADITGFQTLYDEYDVAPLCTMSNWGWHTAPTEDGIFFKPEDVELTRYDIDGRVYEYAVEEKRGNEDVYNWLRHNPHRHNLARIALVWNGREILPSDIIEIKQELELYTGVLRSEFKLFGFKVNVTTVCTQSSDIIGFCIESPALSEGLAVEFTFPYGSHKKNASAWDNAQRHSTDAINGQPLILKRTLDNDVYYIAINENKPEPHVYELTAAFAKECYLPVWDFNKVINDSRTSWAAFWENGGMADFSSCTDERAYELERRIILSQYLLNVHSAGKLPPQETGLLCNSWYGKFHLEMHILHSGWFPLWGRAERLERSIAWYESVLPNAFENAASNGFKGMRWVKMTAPEGINSPSRIATLLIWQQPHIIYMLDLILQAKPPEERAGFVKRYFKLIRHTADFMCDFARLNEVTGKYELPPPLIPAQEEHKPETALNPAFELSYWRFGLKLAVKWGRLMESDAFNDSIKNWENVCNNMADLPVQDGLYSAHQNCPDTFTHYNRDHPSMLFGYGFIPCDAAKPDIMSKTYDRVLECWDFKTMWGWDFALMAMTLVRLGRTDEAINLLLMDADKNSYVKSGNNFQRGRSDLPLYLPGNGSLLFALAMMLAGYGEKHGITGFPQNGMWDGIEVEGIMPLPY